ncbi:MAG: nucleotide-binding protein [Fusobacteriaceae bacterium]|nr:nucleotide-binding protein [Fusobacteriaceae bacterium]
MENIEILKIKLYGIIECIKQYTSEPPMPTLINSLKKALDENNFEIILFSAKEIDDWYYKNINQVLSNEFVYNKDEHKENIKKIKQIIIELEDNLNSYKEIKVSRKPQNIEVKKSIISKVFIVHGHDSATKIEVARFIEQLGFESIILHEQASKGKTIIEKIEEYTDVDFGIVLYTSCDVGKSMKDNELKPRTRQNVVFEHGYLMSKLGRSNVCALVKNKKIELPNDISGIVYISMEDDWKIKLCQEMITSGYEIDIKKLVSN